MRLLIVSVSYQNSKIIRMTLLSYQLTDVGRGRGFVVVGENLLSGKGYSVSSVVQKCIYRHKYDITFTSL
jgi:hypothetical protein